MLSHHKQTLIDIFFVCIHSPMELHFHSHIDTNPVKPADVHTNILHIMKRQTTWSCTGEETDTASQLWSLLGTNVNKQETTEALLLC